LEAASDLDFFALDLPFDWAESGGDNVRAAEEGEGPRDSGCDSLVGVGSRFGAGPGARWR
jgi:hypothetical protein